MGHCPNCDSDFDGTFAFCSRCGKKVVKICPRCRRTYTDGTHRFCIEDGSVLYDAIANAGTATRSDARSGSPPSEPESIGTYVDPGPPPPGSAGSYNPNRLESFGGLDRLNPGPSPPPDESQSIFARLIGRLIKRK